MTIVSDDFQRVNESPIAGNWTVYKGPGSWNLIGGHAEPSFGSSDAELYWNSYTPGPDQFSEAALAINGGGGAGQGIGLSLRSNGTGTPTFYRFVVDHAAGSNVEIARFNAGTYTQLINPTQAWTDGDVWRFEIVGYVLTVKRNGSVVTTYDDSASGSKIASGFVGISFSSNGSTPFSADNWSGGDLGTAAAPIVPRQMLESREIGPF